MQKLDRGLKLLFKLLKRARVRNEIVGCSGIKASLDGRYPYVYPRDLASVASLMELLAMNGVKKTECLRNMENYAEFLYHCQRKDGYVGQRYDGYFQDRSIYKQEDNIAHFIQVLAGFMLASGNFDEEYAKAIKRAIRFALDNYYRDEINLFISTTSVHESAICSGYDIWTNFAYHKAIKDISLLEQVFKTRVLGKQLEGIVAGTQAEHVFQFEDRYLRGLEKEGEPDLRLDFVCLSPFYFGIDMDSNRMIATANILRDALWDPILGGLLRYQAYTEEFEMHLHAGSGPWLQYTAVLAQVFYYNGMKKEGDAVMAVIEKYRQEGENIPEHVSTKDRFEEFMRLEWDTGLDFRKEFDPEILREDTKFDLILEEVGHMKESYNRIRNDLLANPRKKHTIFGCPLIWSHSECCKALFFRERGNALSE